MSSIEMDKINENKICTNCIKCGKEVDWEDVTETFEDIFNDADAFGMESLTEAKQHVVEGGVCSQECYEELD